jgi:hypothetical protein
MLLAIENNSLSLDQSKLLGNLNVELKPHALPTIFNTESTA